MNGPKLRFREFNSEWEKVKLTDITTRIGDGIHSTPKYDEKGLVYFANGSNIRNSVLVFDENTKKINHEEFSKYNSYLNDNSILVSLNGATWGRFGLYQGEIILPGKSLGYINILDMKASKLFMYYQLQLKKIRRFFESEITGSTIKNLSLQTLRNTEVTIPRISEQEKIADFFKKLDQKIQLQQQKIDLLQEQKKGYMQKIFKQELRFKDEDGKDYPEWEKYKLSDLGETYTGLSGKTKEDFGIGDNSFVTYVNVFNNLFAKKTGVEKVIVGENEKQNYVKSGDIFLTTSSETPKEVGMASIWLHESQNLHLNSFCFGYRVTNSKSLPEFLAISLRSEYMRKKITILAQGSTRYNISKTELMKELVYLPSIDEQKKIVTFYLSVGFEIELEMDKLAILKQQKKGFMQQMFI